MKRERKIAIILLIIAIPLLFGAVYTIYANQKIETERIELYNKVIKLDLEDEMQEYLLSNKLLTEDDLDGYNNLYQELLENEDYGIDDLKNVENGLNTYLEYLNEDLEKKVDAKKTNSLKKVNKLKAKTKAEKKSKTNIKKTLNKKYSTSKDNLKNINLLIKKHKALVKQDSKIKALDKKIKKRIAKEKVANQNVTTTTPNYQNSGNNNSGGGSNNSGGGNNNSGDNGRPDWYNSGGTQCLPKENGEVNEVCIVW